MPTRILEKEYNLLFTELNKRIDVDKTFQYECQGKTITMDNILESCYELDNNLIPARYRLKYLDRLFPGMNQKVSHNFLVFL